MSRALRIVAEWESLNEGGAEERSCFAAVGIQANNIWLTEGRDALANRLRQSPLLSAYHLAEWFAFHWWRLRWEPRATTLEWRLAHKMSNIGGGYIWPNITIFSDGERTALIARPSKEKPGAPFRYIADMAAVMPSFDYESEIDSFIEQVLGRLESEKVKETNLSKLWAEVCAERKDPGLSQIRKLEALMGHDPEEIEGSLVSRLISDAKILGMSGIEELVADYPHLSGQHFPSATELSDIAKKVGFFASPNDRVDFSRNAEPQHGQIPAWKIGADTARALREQEKLGDEPISDKLLAQMLAVDQKSLHQHAEPSPADVSFLLEHPGDESRIVLRPKWHTGRRFELARLLGEHLMNTGKGFLPATRAYTYRQKAQRSFAAELLSPFGAIMEMLQGDYANENLGDVAEQFQVSELTIRTQLVNHSILEREDLELELAAA